MPSRKRRESSGLPERSRDKTGPTEYEKLARFLLAHRGHFALGLVRVNSPVQRDGVIASLGDDLKAEGLALHQLDYSQRHIPSLYEELRRDKALRHLLQERSQSLTLAIVGLEGSVELPPRPGTSVPVLVATLNLQRDDLSTAFPIPITLWLSDYAMDRLAGGAPDFFDFFGALFTFRGAPVQKTTPQLQVPPAALIDDVSPPAVMPEAQIDLLHDRLNELQRRREHLTVVEKQRLAEILEQLGEAHLSFKDKGAAVPFFREAAQMYRDLGDRKREAEFLTALGEAYVRSYQWALAPDCYEQALLIYKEIGARLGEANTIQALGDVHMSVAQYEQARRRYEEALPIYKEIGARLGEANTIKALGDAHMSVDQYEQARQHYEIALAISREIKDRYTTAWTLYRLGLAFAAEQQANRAEQVWHEALALFEAIGIEKGAQACREALSRLLTNVPAVAESRQEYEAGEEGTAAKEKE